MHVPARCSAEEQQHRVRRLIGVQQLHDAGDAGMRLQGLEGAGYIKVRAHGGAAPRLRALAPAGAHALGTDAAAAAAPARLPRPPRPRRRGGAAVGAAARSPALAEVREHAELAPQVEAVPLPQGGFGIALDRQQLAVRAAQRDRAVPAVRKVIGIAAAEIWPRQLGCGLAACRALQTHEAAELTLRGGSAGEPKPIGGPHCCRGRQTTSRPRAAGWIWRGRAFRRRRCAPVALDNHQSTCYCQLAAAASKDGESDQPRVGLAGARCRSWFGA